MEVLNQDIYFLVKRMRLFRDEMTRQASNNSILISQPDRIRMDEYLAAAETFKAFVVKQPITDYPKTAPRKYVVGAGPEVPDLDNQDMMMILQLLKDAEDELILSQSGQMHINMTPHDSARFDSHYARVKSFLKDFVDTHAPIDRPESVNLAPEIDLK